MEMIVITPPENKPDEIQWINALLALEVSRLHIRKPHFTQQQVEDYLKQVPAGFLPTISVHYFPELAQKYGTGLHMKYELFSAETEMPGPRSVSIHHPGEFMTIDGKCDYALVSPVWNSISKKGYLQNRNIHMLAQQKRQSKLIAMGGISRNNIVDTCHMGFDGVALLGAVWHSADPLQEFLTIVNDLKNA